ncbi:hypothetical protein RIF29_08862 [Crotalaria pallida]|uniref:Uncharacterized protein n=1 Tax=Crotalaria pallida TaxID=3830 RepID=A0AAN9IKG0_CROPI
MPITSLDFRLLHSLDDKAIVLSKIPFIKKKHHSQENPTATSPIGANVDFPDPLIELSGLELLSGAGENVPELRHGDEAGGVLVQNLERVAELAIERLRFHVLGHHQIQESGEIKGSGEILFGDDGFELGLGMVATERAHEDSELQCSDLAVTVAIEESEGFHH